MTSLPYAVQHVLHHYPKLDPLRIERELRYSTFVSLERRYMYYEVPKAACSTMKTLLQKIEGLPPIQPFTGLNREVRRDMFIHERGLFKMASLLDFDSKVQEMILNSPEIFRFTIVRNPYTRLSSAWRDKVRLCAPGYEYFYAATGRPLPTGSDPDSLLPFEEFLSFISTEDLDLCNNHWRRQTSHTLLAAMNFSHIGKLEQLNATLTEFFTQIGVDRSEAPHAINEAGGWANFNVSTASIIYDLYKQDFDAFGYDPDSWIELTRPEPQFVPVTRYIDEVVERNITIGHLYEIKQTLNDKAMKYSNEVTERNLTIGHLYEKIKQTLNDKWEVKNYDCLNSYKNKSFDEIFDSYIQPIDGWSTKSEISTLYELSSSVSEGCIIEIGSYRGRSTAALALGSLAGSEVPVFAIDPHDFFLGKNGGRFGPIDRGLFMRNMLELGLFHIVRLINLGSDSLNDRWPVPVSLLWMDGDHRYEAISHNFTHWKPSLGDGAIVVLNNAHDQNEGAGKLAAEIGANTEFHRIGVTGNMVIFKYACAKLDTSA